MIEDKKNDYIIYKITCICNTGLLYIGSTINFNRRVNKHKNDCYNENKKCYNIKLYKTIREYGFNNFEFSIICKINNISKKEALITEQYYIYELKPNLNTYKSYITEEEIKQKNQEYRKKNKEKLKEQKHKYNEKNKEKNKETTKVYREKNKEKIKEKSKKYYETNIEKIKERKNEKITCECGKIITRNHIAQHKKSNIHLKKMECIKC